MSKGDIIATEWRGVPVIKTHAPSYKTLGNLLDDKPLPDEVFFVAGDYVHLIVLVAGGADDYAAYEGIVPAYTDEELNIEAVKRFGNKLLLNAARQYFTNLNETKYRI